MAINKNFNVFLKNFSCLCNYIYYVLFLPQTLWYYVLTMYVSNIMIPYQSFVISLISNHRYDVKIKKKLKNTKIRKDYYSIYCCDLWLNTNPILFIPNNYKCSKYTFRWSMTIVIHFLSSFSQKKTHQKTH